MKIVSYVSTCQRVTGRTDTVVISTWECLVKHNADHCPDPALLHLAPHRQNIDIQLNYKIQNRENVLCIEFVTFSTWITVPLRPSWKKVISRYLVTFPNVSHIKWMELQMLYFKISFRFQQLFWILLLHMAVFCYMDTRSIFQLVEFVK